MFDLEAELKKLPDQPGVYLMHNREGTIIYVGKAKILKNRVRQYFQNNAQHTPKVKAMVANIAYFEYIITDSEVEALVLECNLIKKHRPKYNILLKDDKQYPYIKVTIQEDYPKISMTRRLLNDGAKYFGPYMGSETVRNTIDVVQKIFHPPLCRRKFPDDIGKGRPCLNYHIKNCFAPCRGGVSREDYREVFFRICSFLEGNHKQLLTDMEAQMREASANLAFEKAAALRDEIKAINALEQKQKIIKTDSIADKDVIAYARGDNMAFFEVFFIRGGKLIGRESYQLKDTDDVSKNDLMSDFVKQFYSVSVNLPEEILMQVGFDDSDVIRDWLREKRGKKVILTVPKRGEKAELIKMVKKNADIARDNYEIRVMKREKNQYLEEFTKALGLERPPARIEAYDISNISGRDSVGAMVVFENGKPANKKYRHFKIQSVEGADDYASTQEVIYRRFRHALEEQNAIDAGELRQEDAKFLPLPDLILADGGKGHVGAIMEMLEQIDTEVPVFGMVKDDRHRTRALMAPDGREIEMNPVGSVFHFVTRIQDEVHRFAISYFRRLRTKTAFHSKLDDVPGVGEKRRKQLIDAFGSVEGIKQASLDEVAAVVGNALALKVKEGLSNY